MCVILYKLVSTVDQSMNIEGEDGGLVGSTFASYLRCWGFDARLRVLCVRSLHVLSVLFCEFPPDTLVSSPVQKHALLAD